MESTQSAGAGDDLDKLYQQLTTVESMAKKLKGLQNNIRHRETLLRCKADKSSRLSDERSLSRLQEERTTLSGIMQQLDSLRGSFRQDVNLLSRPYLRSLTIMDLPNEILMIIFGYVKGWEPLPGFIQEWGSGTDEVRNLRLTCRRFCDSSSHLLIHFLEVDLDLNSLQRFEEISRHPTIRKGVQAVRLRPRCYAKILADDILEFAEYRLEELQEELESMVSMADFITTGAHAVPKETLEEAIEKVEAVLESWHRFIIKVPEDPNDECDLAYRALIKISHQEYQRRHGEQQSLVQGGSFVANFAAAIARMPTCTTLSIEDQMGLELRQVRGAFWDYAKDGRALAKNMILPHSWQDTGLIGLSRPPVEILLQLPVAIRQVGVWLTSFHIKVSPNEDFSQLASNKQDLCDLTAAVQGLQRVTFSPNNNRDLDFWSDDEQHIPNFLIALLDSKSITSISLDLDFLNIEKGSPSVDLGSVITHRTWENLRFLHLRSVGLHLKDLDKFVSGLSASAQVSFHFDDVELLSGTWAAGLDVLRSKSSWYPSLDSPKGAECDEMSKDDKAIVFGKEHRAYNNHSLAEKYIAGWIQDNPLTIADIA